MHGKGKKEAEPPLRVFPLRLGERAAAGKPTKRTTDTLGKIQPELRDDLQLIENTRRESFTNPTGMRS